MWWNLMTKCMMDGESNLLGLISSLWACIRNVDDAKSFFPHEKKLIFCFPCIRFRVWNYSWKWTPVSEFITDKPVSYQAYHSKPHTNFIKPQHLYFIIPEEMMCSSNITAPPEYSVTYQRMSLTLCRELCKGKSHDYAAVHNLTCSCYNQGDGKITQNNDNINFWASTSRNQEWSMVCPITHIEKTTLWVSMVCSIENVTLYGCFMVCSIENVTLYGWCIAYPVEQVILNRWSMACPI